MSRSQAGTGSADADQTAAEKNAGAGPKKKGAIRRILGRLGKVILPPALVLLFISVLVVLFFLDRTIVIIRSGEAGALYRTFFGGTVTNYVYPEGLHIFWPWDNLTKYNIRVQTTLHEFTVLTNKGLPISLELAIRYYPEYEMVGLLHKKVGPDYVNTIVVPQIESVLRRNIGKQDPEDIYTNKEGILTNIIVKAIEEAGQKFVYIDDIIIRTVTLPQDVKDAIDDKLVQQQRWQTWLLAVSGG